MQWDGIRYHTNLGKGPLFLICYLSARTAREYARPTLGASSYQSFNPVPVVE
jgi:hypothetical protein